MGDIDRRLKGAPGTGRFGVGRGFGGGGAGKGEGPETVKGGGDLEEPPPAWGGQDPQDDWGGAWHRQDRDRRPRASGVMHAQDELLTAYQHTVPPTRRPHAHTVPQTRRPHAHTAPLTILFRNRTGPWLDKGGEVGGSIGPGPVSPAGWPSPPCPGPWLHPQGWKVASGLTAGWPASLPRLSPSPMSRSRRGRQVQPTAPALGGVPWRSGVLLSGRPGLLRV